MGAYGCGCRSKFRCSDLENERRCGTGLNAKCLLRDPLGDMQHFHVTQLHGSVAAATELSCAFWRRAPS